jgi:Arc/MetJ family transcription regulator
MVAHIVKTTIEIADDLLARAKRKARRERKTLRDVVEEALREALAGPAARQAFRLKKQPFQGKGRQPGIAEGQWEAVRDLIYRLG